jgi:hypothetical protein
MTCLKNILLAAFAAATLIPVQGAILVDEKFTDLTGWTDTTGGNWSVGTNLTYTGWASSGNAAAELTTGTGTRLANESILGGNSIAEGQTYWGGILMNVSSGYTAARNFGFGEAAAGPFRINMYVDASNNFTVGTRDDGADPSNGGNNTTGSAIALGTGTTHLLLFRIDSKAGNDDFYAWWNPDLSTFNPGSTAGTQWTSIGIDDFATTSNLAAFTLDSSNSAQVTFDELRLGDSFTAVIPEPSTFALFGLAGLAAMVGLKRRR